MAIMAWGVMKQGPKGPRMNRWLFGFSLIMGAILWWLTTAILLASEGKFFPMADLVVVLIFFLGLAALLPHPLQTKNPARQSRIKGAIALLGVGLGLVQSVAMILVEAWPEKLSRFYESLGIH